MANTYFVRLLKPHITVDGRTYEEGEVAAVDKFRRITLVNQGHAEDFTGDPAAPLPPTLPAPAPAVEDLDQVDGKPNRSGRVERAARH
jgi:hypothetical protein